MTLNRNIARRVLAALKAYYGPPATSHPKGEPLDALIGTILSQHTSDINSHRAFETLRRALPTWEAVAAAPVDRIADAIRSGGLAGQKSVRIKKVLQRIKETEGRLNLDRLKSMSDADAYEYLTALPGVGDKTACCVLLFSLGRSVMPVDTHIHRITRRLGWIDDKTSPADARAVLERAFPPEDLYDLHVLLIAHGRQTCTARNPKCDCCPLRKFCAYGSGVMG